MLWTIDLDADGDTVDVRLERALVRSRAKLDYAGVQAAVDAGRPPEPVALLPEIGALLVERGLDRGAINLPMPEQEIEPDGGGCRLVLRAPAPVEEYNAQISLLTGMAAAAHHARRRHRPAAHDAAAAPRRPSSGCARPRTALRHRLAGRATSPGRVVAAVDPADPRGAAFLDQAAELMRGAGYTAFDGAAPEQPGHGGVAAPYAHVTAPLRRLADRYATEVCLALFTRRATVPEWAREALPELPEVMASTDRVANAAEPRRGRPGRGGAAARPGRARQFDAAVVDVDEPKPNREPGGTVALDDPPVRARCAGTLPLGERVRRDAGHRRPGRSGPVLVRAGVSSGARMPA